MVRQKIDLLKPGKLMDECLHMLLDEILQAVNWSRPSILVALHKSKNDQSRTIVAMKQRLEKNPVNLNVESIALVNESSAILNGIINGSKSYGSVFFIHSLGEDSKVYAGLNMYREAFVEHRIKVIFWLTLEEMNMLSHLAPDFWAFRHRVIEFPTGRTSRKINLPAGTLLWDYENSFMTVETIYKKINYQEHILQNISSQSEMTSNHVQIILDLAYLYWLIGENQYVAMLLHSELENIRSAGLTVLQSKLLNASAVNYFDQYRHNEALESINGALELAPEQSIYWSNHGIICRSAGQGRKSLPSVKKAVKLDPFSYKCQGVLGYMYMSLGKFATALMHFREALKIHPDNEYFYPALAICCSQTGNIAVFDEVMGRLADLAEDDDYLAICYTGLSGNKSHAMEQLNGLVRNQKIPRLFIQRDSNLHFILNISSLQDIL